MNYKFIKCAYFNDLQCNPLPGIKSKAMYTINSSIN